MGALTNRGGIGFWAATGVLLAAMGWLLVTSVRNESQTWDEAIEIAGGYRYLKTGEYRYFTEHPPLGKVLSALPLLWLNPALPDEGGRTMTDAEYGSAFLYRNRVPADTMLFAARAMTVGVTLCLGLALAFWTRRAFGAGAALVAVALYSFDPNVLSQGRYTKSGLLLTLAAFLCVTFWTEYLDRGRRRMLAGAGMALGLGLATKFSAVFLIPALVILQALHRKRERLPATAAGLVRPHLLLAGLSAAILVASYAPESRALMPRLPQAERREDKLPSLRSRMDQSTLTGRTIAWVGARLGLRAHNLFIGLGQFAAYNRAGHPAYLLGEISQHGWWYYFPVAFAVKTPLGALLLLVMAAGCGLVRRPWKRGLSLAAWAMIVPLLVYLPLCLTSTIDTGVRHLLPVYPFLFAATGAAVSGAFPRLGWAAAALVAVAAVETLSVYPHFTAFFNRAAGGPENGSRYLLDSNLDWGQDLKNLKAYMQRQGVARACLEYFGTADPRYYGIEYSLITEPERQAQSCVLAVSATPLFGLYEKPGKFAWLRGQRPVARVGYSIYVYDLRTEPGPRGR
jgi:4-amino-4-deoxy-L-arabinose transferase-like glycosyltransferase